MLKLKPKRKSAAKEAAAPRNLTEEVKIFGNRVMQKLFGVSADWYKQRDVVKNNYQLGVRYLKLSSANDAILRFKLTLWFDKTHVEAWYGLARAHLMRNKRAAAEWALKKTLELNPSYAGAAQLLKAIPIMYAEKPAIGMWEVKADAARVLAGLHREAFVKPWDEKAFAEMLAVAGTEAWVNGLSDVAMGMIVGRALGEQYEILTLAVSPEWRKRNLARQLLEKATERAKETGAKAMILDVAVDNEAARKFYEGAGYAVVNTRKDYYRAPDGRTTDALVMRLELA